MKEVFESRKSLTKEERLDLDNIYSDGEGGDDDMTMMMMVKVIK